MEITSNFGTPGPAMGTASAGQSDYQTFLNMLTVQMRNQDPLNPMNSTEFAVQLATFSGVEQQSYTNQLLSSMLNQTGLSDLGSWVGMEARIYGGAWYEGESIKLTPDPALGADEVTLIVRDSNGNIVDNRSLETDALSYEWDGLGADGQPLPDGTYTFEIESKSEGEVIDTQPVAAYVPILEARYENGATMLVLPGNLWVDSAAVTGLRRPS
ncbi:flagellar hook capping FlgD N-terminal domain-containing protein [Pararhodobacter sp.]|uniref:flagellar hook capping FlgD N-terminal domain-containing protein n=1 Tax=Pararhodobacter sp. TaxID=2127056 RepID=UPI002B001E03|nr:flagellar hook capping FlgD N-terminal domain-containing protein [Pararhodobacter sp.]